MIVSEVLKRLNAYLKLPMNKRPDFIQDGILMLSKVDI